MQKHLRVTRKDGLLPVSANANPCGKWVEAEHKKEPYGIEQDVIHEQKAPVFRFKVASTGGAP